MTFLSRAASICLAVVLVLVVTDWALTFSARRAPAEPVRVLPAGELDPQAQSADVAPIGRLLGASAGGESAGGIRALGVMAEGASGRGIAIIGVDGKPPRAVRAGEAIAPGVVLTEVQRDGVLVNRSGALQEIKISTKPAPVGILRAP